VGSGFVTATDGVRLYYQTHSHGEDHLVVPGAVLVQEDLLPLAEGRTVMFYDIRNRGRSDRVPAEGAVGVPVEVDDIDAIRGHFGLERISLLGWSYVGLIAALYAARYPSRLDRLVMVCSVPPRDHDYGLPQPDPGLTTALLQLDKLREAGVATKSPWRTLASTNHACASV
jgi:proline iminopeptidase